MFKLQFLIYASFLESCRGIYRERLKFKYLGSKLVNKKLGFENFNLIAM